MPLRIVGAGSPERLALHEAVGARAFQASDLRASDLRGAGARGFQPSDRRTAAAIGRQARLDLAFARRGNRTVLVRGYAEPPLRVPRVFDLDGAAYAILVCAGPGIFGGDALTVSVHVGSGARVVLASQAALQAHPSAAAPEAAALLRHTSIVDDDGELHCHWDPLIPFAAAHVDQRFDVQLGAGARLYWGDALMAGRVSRGETWRFASLAHELSIACGTRLAYLERYTVTPLDRAVERRWISGGATHLATTVICHPRATGDTVEDLHARASGVPGVAAAVDLVEPAIAVARMMSATAAPFGTLRASYREWALASIFRRPELRVRK